MFQQMIYRVCSAARKQLRASGQDIIVSGEMLNALATVATVVLVETRETGCLRSEVRITSRHLIRRSSGCTSDSAVHAVTYIFPVLTVSDLLHLRSAPGPATPAAQHPAST